VSVAAARQASAAPSNGNAATWRLGTGLAAAAAIAGVVAGELVVTGHGWGLLALILVVLPALLWRRPELGPVVLVVAALTIEQFPYVVGPRYGTLTDKIPLFRGLGASAHVNAADLALLVLLGIWLLKRSSADARLLSRSATSKSMLALGAAVFVGLLVGQAHHGDLRTALTEVRPYAYLAVAYVLASALLTTRKAIWFLLWALVLSTGFKAAQGLIIFFVVRNVRPRPEAILGHEEALFFAVFIFLTFALWLFHIRGSLRTTATALLPIVLAADLANSRRVAWLILVAGFVAVVVIGFATLPGRRPFLRRLVAIVALVGAIYLPIYWNHTGSLSQPARALRSAIAPSARDAASDLYRIQENENLKYNIRQAGVLGKGFGVPIDYALPIVDISSIDPLIKYIPHNGVLYILMRMGLLGGIAFWSLLAAGIITACRLVRSSDRELAVVGTLIVCALLAYAFQGYNDQGFFFYRIAFVIGTLLGLGEACLHLRSETAVEHEGSSIAPLGVRT
jgi:hypothetical protein